MNHVQRPRGPDTDCSPVELLMLQYASRGLTGPETASAEGTTPAVVRNRLQLARLKLAARTTTQAVAIAMRRGLIP